MEANQILHSPIAVLSKFLVSWCVNLQTSPFWKAFYGFQTSILTRYLGDFGCLGRVSERTKFGRYEYRF